MNLGAIKRCCMARRVAIVMNAENGEQWISDGSNAWPVDGLRVDAGAVVSLFNLTIKQQDKTIIREMDTDDPRFTIYETPGEEMAREIGLMEYMDSLLLGLESSRGVLWIPYDAIRHIKEDGRWYGVRWRDGRAMVAVYGDMFAAALVLPVMNHAAEYMQAKAARMAAAPYKWPDEKAAAAEAEAAAEAMLKEMGGG